MKVGRREFLAGTGLALAAASGAKAATLTAPDSVGDLASDWEAVRRSFALSNDLIHMSAMLLASHPAPVRVAIERHRAGLDADPVGYLNDNYSRLEAGARIAAGAYLGLTGAQVALTDSTTMGVGLVYNGLRLGEGDEIVTTARDYYVTHESLRLVTLRTGATVKRIPLYERPESASEEELAARIEEAVGPATRAVALTWVHSGTGVKLPIRRIADALSSINAGRDEKDRVLLCVDGVHGFGIEDETLESLGCDFLMAGCHKWLFGPRGTGIVAGRAAAWARLLPTIPSYSDRDVFDAWLEGRDPASPTSAAAMTPGGFKPFDHRWALPEAFAFHQAMGKSRVAARTHELASQLKEGLAAMPNVTLRTPRDNRLSSGIVCFDVEGLSADSVVARLKERRIVGSVTPYAVTHARLTPSVFNTPAEIDRALSAVHALAS